MNVTPDEMRSYRRTIKLYPQLKAKLAKERDMLYHSNHMSRELSRVDKEIVRINQKYIYAMNTLANLAVQYYESLSVCEQVQLDVTAHFTKGNKDAK